MYFYAPQLYSRYCWERVLAMGIMSVRLSVCLSDTIRYEFKARWDRDSGSSPYDSLVSSLLRGNLVPLGEEIPSNEFKRSKVKDQS